MWIVGSAGSNHSHFALFWSLIYQETDDRDRDLSSTPQVELMSSIFWHLKFEEKQMSKFDIA